MGDLRELYQEVILDHGRSPRNFRDAEGANREAEGHNPLCGDQIRITLRYRDGVIEDIAFSGKGCAISQASASMLTEALRGKTREDADHLAESFRAMVRAAPGTPPDLDRLSADLGKLAVFSGVCEFPNRVKCASLAWHTLEAALEGNDEPVSTE